MMPALKFQQRCKQFWRCLFSHEGLYHIGALQLMREKGQLNLVLEEASEFSFCASRDTVSLTHLFYPAAPWDDILETGA